MRTTGGGDDGGDGGRVRGGLDLALVDLAPREAPAPPPGKRALTDYLPPSGRGGAQDAGPHGTDGHGRTAIHRPPAPAHPPRSTAPLADTAGADDPFALHIAPPKRVRVPDRLAAATDTTSADTTRPRANLDVDDE